MPKFKVGDIIVARDKTPIYVWFPGRGKVLVHPWVFGKVVFVHPERGHFTYYNGDFNQSEWIEDAYTLKEWVSHTHSSRIPVLNRGIV